MITIIILAVLYMLHLVNKLVDDATEQSKEVSKSPKELEQMNKKLDTIGMMMSL